MNENCSETIKNSFGSKFQFDQVILLIKLKFWIKTIFDKTVLDIAKIFSI